MGRESKRSGKERKKGQPHETRDDDLVKKLADQVARSGLRIVDVTGDGNCLFRSISDQLCGTQHKHAEYRRRILEFVVAHRENYEPFIEDDKKFDDYVREMAEDGEWGGQLEIVAACHAYRVNCVIHQVDSPAWEICNYDRAPTMHLAYFSHEHYGSVRSREQAGDSEPAIAALPPARSMDAAAARRMNESEAAVCRASGCDDLAAIRDALDECCGDVYSAAELLTYRVRRSQQASSRRREPEPEPVPPAASKPGKKPSNKERKQTEKERRRAFEENARRGPRSPGKFDHAYEVEDPAAAATADLGVLRL